MIEAQDIQIIASAVSDAVIHRLQPFDSVQRSLDDSLRCVSETLVQLSIQLESLTLSDDEPNALVERIDILIAEIQQLSKAISER